MGVAAKRFEHESYWAGSSIVKEVTALRLMAADCKESVRTASVETQKFASIIGRKSAIAKGMFDDMNKAQEITRQCIVIWLRGADHFDKCKSIAEGNGLDPFRAQLDNEDWKQHSAKLVACRRRAEKLVKDQSEVLGQVLARKQKVIDSTHARNR